MTQKHLLQSRNKNAPLMKHHPITKHNLVKMPIFVFKLKNVHVVDFNTFKYLVVYDGQVIGFIVVVTQRD